MKPILSEALGSIWLCYLTVNRHITSFCLMPPSKIRQRNHPLILFLPSPYKKLLWGWGCWPAVPSFWHVPCPALHGDKARAAQGRGSCWQGWCHVRGWHSSARTQLSGSQNVLAFRATQTQQLPLPWAWPWWGQSPAWHRGHACWKDAWGWGGKSLFGAAWLWPCELADPALPGVTGCQPWAPWPQLSQVKAAGSRPWECPWPLWQWQQGVFLLFSCTRSGFDTFSVTKKKAVLETGSSQGWCAQLPSPALSRNSGEKQKCWDAPAPALVGVGLSGGQFLSQSVQKMLHYFIQDVVRMWVSGEWEEGKDQLTCWAEGSEPQSPTLRHRAGKHLHTSVTIKGRLAS